MKILFLIMSLREEIEQEERSGNKQNAWMLLATGILLLLIGLVLQFGKNLHDSVTQASSRYSSEIYYVHLSPKPTAIALMVLSFFFFLLSYGCFRKLKNQKKNSL